MAKTKWVIDPAHSEFQFKVKHMMITTVTGYFRTFNLEVETDGDDFSTASRIEFTADVDSIDTNNEQRDTHLKSAKLHGDLTIRGTTKPVTVEVELGGIVVDPYGQTKAGFSVTGKIGRKEFGLTWNAVTEAGKVVVGDDVKILAEIQLIKQA